VAPEIFPCDAGVGRMPRCGAEIRGSGRLSAAGQRENLGRLGHASLHSRGLSSTSMKLSSARSCSAASEARLPPFRFPIDAAGGEIVQTQRHFGVRVKGFEDVLFVVLTAQGEQRAFAAAPAIKILKSAAWWIECDSLGTVFAADAAPESVAAIARDHLVRRMETAWILRAMAARETDRRLKLVPSTGPGTAGSP
jgi:hypothetical protein